MKYTITLEVEIKRKPYELEDLTKIIVEAWNEINSDGLEVKILKTEPLVTNVRK